MPAMKFLQGAFFYMLIFSVHVLTAQSTYEKEMEVYQEELNAEYRDKDKSPLSRKERLAFKGHDFFPIDEKYRVIAKFEPTPDAKPFPLGTSKGTTKIYKAIGKLHFELDGTPYVLEAYLEQKRFTIPGMKVYVFLPIIDETTGNSTYGAGRYLHYEGIPEGTEWVIDFNKLYNPYCAYSDNYECPMVPEANHLPISIEAGIRGPEH
jgi:uncharacterized protein